MTAHHKKVCVKFFSGASRISKKNFKPTRIVSRTHSRPIWTRTGEKWYNWKRWITYPPQPPLKNEHLGVFFAWSNLGTHPFLHWYKKYGTLTYDENPFTACFDCISKKINIWIYFTIPPIFSTLLGSYVILSSPSLRILCVRSDFFKESFISSLPLLLANLIFNFLTPFVPRPIMVVKFNKNYLELPKEVFWLFFAFKFIINAFTGNALTMTLKTKKVPEYFFWKL